jgi:steroid 5-alpha reductase family enzyme
METVSDSQKFRFRSNNKDKGAICDVGFFSWTRHPNYFGEIIIQFGGQYPSFASTGFC